MVTDLHTDVYRSFKSRNNVGTNTRLAGDKYCSAVCVPITVIISKLVLSKKENGTSAKKRKYT